MNAIPAKIPEPTRCTPLSFRGQAGQPLLAWVLIALFQFAFQIILRHDLAPGEFGTLNTALGLIALATVPMAALHLGLVHYLARELPAERHAAVQAALVALLDAFAWVWGVFALVLFCLAMPFLGLPRWSISVFILFNIPIALGGLISLGWYQARTQTHLWGILLLCAALLRLLIAGYLGRQYAWAEDGLIALLVSNALLLKPLFSRDAVDWKSHLRLCRAALDRDLVFHLGVTFCVVLALFIFSSADRIVAQGWFGIDRFGYGFLDWDAFDAYQTAGLLGRALIWGAQPLLLLLVAQRLPLARTTPASLRYFWAYLGVLLGGALALIFLRQPLGWLFCGHDDPKTISFIASFAFIMIPVGMLQAVGYFALASRRYIECFVLAGCSIGYFFLLFLAGRQPELMIAYIFGGACASLLIVLFIGIVRWGRQNP